MKTRLALSLALMAGIAGFLASPSAQAQRVPAGSVLKVELLEPLSSKTARVGDKVRVRVTDSYDTGVQKGSVLVGRVTQVQRASKNQPGIVDISFRTLEHSSGWVPITAELSPLPDQETRDASGRITGKRKSTDRWKFVGYGAAGGAVLGTLLGKKLINSALIGGAAGYLYSLTQKKKGYSDVNLKAGDDFGVRLTRPVRITSAVAPGPVLARGASSDVPRGSRAAAQPPVTLASAAQPAARRAAERANENIPEGTVIEAVLEDSISSKTARRGDRVVARVADGDRSGIPVGSRLYGAVTEVQKAGDGKPGVIDIVFDRIEMETRGGDTESVRVVGQLASLDENDVERTASGRLVGKKRSGSNTKFIGYGAAGGAVLGQLMGGNLLRGALIGAAAGYLYGITQKDKAKFRDVELDEGTRFGVRLDNPLRIDSSLYRASTRDLDSSRPSVGEVLGGDRDDNAAVRNTQLGGRAGVLRERYASRLRSNVPEDTVVKVELLGTLNSKTSKVGDRVTVQVAEDDHSGLVPGMLLIGRVTQVQKASKDRPGAIDVQFHRLDTGSRTIAVAGDLASLSSDDVQETAEGRLVSKRKKTNRLQFVGIGAAGGAVLGQLMGGNLLRGALLGAAAGYVYSLTQKNRGYRDVDLKEGQKFGVRLTQPVTLRA